jgi:hypothetical protein
VIVKEIWMMMMMESFVQLAEVVAVAEGAVEAEAVEEVAADGAQDSLTGA